MNKLIHAVVAFLLCFATNAFATVTPQDTVPGALLTSAPAIKQAANASMVKTSFAAPARGAQAETSSFVNPSFQTVRVTDLTASDSSPADKLLTVLAGIALIGVIAIRRMSV